MAQVHALRGFVTQARERVDRQGLNEHALTTIDTTDPAVAATTSTDAKRIDSARIGDKILTALMSLEVPATQLPRFEHKRATAE